MQSRMQKAAATIPLMLVFAACEQQPVVAPDVAVAPDQTQQAKLHGALDGPFTGLAAPIFDIAATPAGSILLAEFTTVREIRRGGDVDEVITVPTVEGSAINGLEPIGRGNFFATSAGLDLAVGAGLWRVSRGKARLVADIEAFETENNPDATEGPQWKDVRCEEAAGFSPGPQSNPYHLTALSGSEVLIGDAAGNTVLWAKTNGDVDWVAVVTPPVDQDDDWLVWTTLEDGTDCYVQPVPTSVAIGPDGAYYVGELTGTTADDLAGMASTGLSRVWRIEPGARNVVCPSADCEEVISGLTSVIDVAFGPDGLLYVVEYDENGWFGALQLGDPAGGAIKSCDVESGICETVEAGLTLPGAITFDKRGNLWVLENNIIDPVVRRVEAP